MKTFKNFSIDFEDFLKTNEWYLFTSSELRLFKKSFTQYDNLESKILFASEGIHSGKDEVFFISNEQAAILDNEKIIQKLAKGKDIHRYDYIIKNNFDNNVIYPYDLNSGQVIIEDVLKKQYPHTYKYLVQSKKKLSGRTYFEKSAKKWYELWCPRNPKLYVKKTIVGPEITNCGNFTISNDMLFVNNKIKSIILAKKVKENILYILALLNSKFLVYLHRIIAPPKGNNYFEVKTAIIGKLPIKTIDFSNPAEKAQHDKMVSLVETMLETQKQNQAAKSDQEKKQLQQKVDILDNQIDTLVYELYGLTEDEIKIVEEGI